MVEKKNKTAISLQKREINSKKLMSYTPSKDD